MNPPRLGSNWGKQGSRLRDFGKYKGYFKKFATSIPAFPTFECKWGKWASRLILEYVKKEI